MEALSSCCSKNILYFSCNKPAKASVLFFPSNQKINVTFTSSFLSLCVKHWPIPLVRASNENQVGLEMPETEEQEINEAKTMRIKFQLQKNCSFGEQFMIVGDDSVLGLWDPENALPLNWSDRHVWTVELDVPVGKTILFKFVLRDIMGKFLWQPGADRILQTWETNNTVVVWEDWENPELQRTTEEEHSTYQIEGTAVNSGTMIVTENLTPQEEKPSQEGNGTVMLNVNSFLEKEQSSENQENPVITDRTTIEQERPAAIVADNISHTEHATNVGKEVSDTKRTDHPSKEALVTSNNCPIGGENVLEDSRVTNIMDSGIEGIGEEANLVIHVEEPVLVPGLSPAPAVSTKVASVEKEEEKGDSASDISLQASEVKNHNVPEFDEKHEGNPPEEEIINVVINDTHLDDKPKEKPEAAEKESIPCERGILQNDIHWGRKTLQKWLGNFRFL